MCVVCCVLCVVCCVILCCERGLEVYSVVNCDMERQDYQVLQENDLSHDLNVVNVDNRVEMTVTHLHFRKIA